jgi:hypothetical protein
MEEVQRERAIDSQDSDTRGRIDRARAARSGARRKEEDESALSLQDGTRFKSDPVPYQVATRFVSRPV